MANAKFPVILVEQGKPHKTIMVPSSATVRTALAAAKLNPDALGGAITVNGEAADLAQRLSKDDLIAVTPKVAGGK